MKASLMALILVCAPLCSEAGDAPKPPDQEKLQGVWVAQTESQNGQTRNVTYQYVFRGNRLTFRDETGKQIGYSFRVESASSPKIIFIRPEEALADSTPVGVAYELDGDSLKIVVAPPGSRPADISDRNDQELIVCKRKSP